MKTGALILFFISSFYSFTQTITLDECRKMARENYPSIARFNIIEKVKSFNLANANAAYFPQLSLSAKATYQSDITKIPVEIPNIDIPVPAKDQYQIYAQLNQIIWDGGQIAAQKESIAANAEVEKQKLETEIYSLYERVNNVFFGILLLKEQLEQQNTLEEELQRNFDKVRNYIANGVANDADLSAVKVEQLKAGQQRIQMQSTLDAYLKVLSVLIGQQVGSNAEFAKPAAELLSRETEIGRPELRLFDAQHKLLNSHKLLLGAKNRPIIVAFVHSGYGKPALNMFENKFSPYFIGGVSFSWNFGNLYTYKNENKNIDQQIIASDLQRETFVYNLNQQILQQQGEVEKYRKIMQDDNEIIRLRQQIKEAAEAKTENGTMTVSDMLREINALKIAEQTKSLHEIQYLMSICNLKQITN